MSLSVPSSARTESCVLKVATVRRNAVRWSWRKHFAGALYK